MNATKSKLKSDTDCMQMNELEMKGNKALSCGVGNETDSVVLYNDSITFHGLSLGLSKYTALDIWQNIFAVANITSLCHLR